MVSVPESYLNSLNATLNGFPTSNGFLDSSSHPGVAAAGDAASQAPNAGSATTSGPPDTYTLTSAGGQTSDAIAPLIKDSTAESFLHKLKEVLADNGSRCERGLPSRREVPITSSPRLTNNGGETRELQSHAPMQFDTACTLRSAVHQPVTEIARLEFFLQIASIPLRQTNHLSGGAKFQ